MKHFCLLLSTICGLVWASPILAENIVVRAGSIEMLLDPAAPELTCRVVRTSGDAKRDDAACAVAAARHRRRALLYPKGTSFYGDAQRHPAECRLNDHPLPSQFRAMCASHVLAMKKARFPLAINPQAWLQSSELASLTGPAGQGMVRLGIDAQGIPSYCLVATRSGNPALDRRACDVMMKRARYEPALDSAGFPTPAVDHRAYRWNG